ncbi:diguanylate cyclase [Couchioplanes caeruleus subsp. azureus]
MRAVRVGAVQGGVGPGLAMVYLLGTLGQPHRPVMLTVAALMLLMAVLGWFGASAVSRLRARLPVQLSGAVLNLAGSAVLAWLDGGVASPLGPMLPLSVTFLAIVVPPRTFTGFAVLGALGYWTVAVVADPAPPGYAVVHTLSFGFVGYLALRYSGTLASLRRRLAEITRVDPLTGCLNRRGFEERLGHELAAAARTGEPVTVAVVDLDRFKEVNDSYGHRAGDDLLAWVGRTLGAELRTDDAVGRLGGDEFAVLLPGTDADGAATVVQRLRVALGDCAGGSIGHASFPDDAVDADELMLVADRRLYADKTARERRVPSAEAVAAVRRTLAAQTPVMVSHAERRRHSIADGGWMTLAQSAISMGYVLLFTAGDPHRTAMAALCAVTALLGLAVVAAAGRLSRSPAARQLMLAYSVITFCNAAAGAWLDGDVSSAFGIGMLTSMPLAMLALRAHVAVPLVAGASLAYLAVATLRGAPSGWYVMTHLTGMFAVAAACAVQGRTAARQRAQLTRLSRTDALTGCLNRRGFAERFTGETAHARRTGRTVSLLVLDLDGFKQLNDAHGHAAGDELLCWVAATLHAAAQPGDIVARLGGDEFVMLVGADAGTAAADLRTALAARTAVSIGTAILGPDGDDFDTLYAAADTRLYEEKSRHAGGRLVPVDATPSPGVATGRHAVG